MTAHPKPEQYIW